MKTQLSAATHKTLSRAWRKLTTRHFELNGFASLDELLDEFDGVNCGGPFDFVLSRLDPALKFEPGNVRLSQNCDENLAATSWPCF